MKKYLSVFSLAMINIAVLGSIKNWPVTAEYGAASLFLFSIAALFFFIPTALVSAELATGWPKDGGVFAWVKEAFGHRAGFLSIWLLWLQNVIWFPTALSTIAGSAAYIFNPSLIHSPAYNVIVILVLIWGATFANLRGMRTSSWISTIGVTVGTFIPGLFLITLGAIWFFTDRTLQITFSWEQALPQFEPQQLAFFAGLILSLMGMEMSAVHARDVQNPQRAYPRAILLSGIVILALSLFGALSIAIMIPQKDISLAAGTIQAFASFLTQYGLRAIIPYAAALMTVGIIGSMSTWLAGPCRGLVAAAQSGDLPPLLRTVNRHGMPTAILLVQAIVVSALSLLFVLMPDINSAYWILLALVSLLYLLMYFLLFGAAIRLRYKRPDVFRSYKIPGGKVGIWIVAGVGFVSTTLTFIVGFFPPAQLSTGSSLFYVAFLGGATLLIALTPRLILLFKKPHWVHPSWKEEN